MRSALLFSALGAAAGEVLYRVLLTPGEAAAHQAVCLDGSPAGYYLRERPNSTGWVLYLQGGGLCMTSIDCRSRMKGGEGSSKHWAATMEDTNNVLASPEEGNPFGEYSHVWVPYCSGDTWTGTMRFGSNSRVSGSATTAGRKLVGGTHRGRHGALE